MISCAVYPKSIAVWETDDGRNWKLSETLARRSVSETKSIDTPPDTRLVWNKKDAFFVACGSACGSSSWLDLFSTKEAKPFEEHGAATKPRGKEPYEGDYIDCELMNNDSQFLCLTNTKYSTRLGIIKPPFKEWNWIKIVPPIRKPNLLQLPDKRVIVSTAIYQGGLRHALFELDPFILHISIGVSKAIEVNLYLSRWRTGRLD